ncbi:uncharacterized protein Dyak_GE19957 [Drosophila yakuba]|uniref:C2H2-type domain-containing protein n=1 Tax=Drosophila yakuba TaxID=7245 RepID=B4PJ18_DROYA|nr:uncharacterized protein Dyak_GE19957 [Drosophila yakuba]
MFDEPISSFVFTNEETTQTFHHQWFAQGQLHECATCYSSIDADEPPSQHWLRGGEASQGLQLTKQQQAVLDIIEARQIETFFFCDESSKDKLEHFMGETCARGIPELLRWMFQNNTVAVEFNLACYVNAMDQVLIFQSGSLRVDHHYDVDESVGVVYEMLMQRIENYLNCSSEYGMAECSITRLKVQVKRIRVDAEDSSSFALPLQLQEDEGLTTTTGCSTSENNIMGQFQRLHELSTPVNSIERDQTSSPLKELHCRRCRTQFSRRSKLHIHQKLRCGQDFSVDSMHADIVEIYEQCLPISRSVFQHACYGITKPKTVMRKGQFVPIECDWRSESSVKVQHGPCVVISNAQHSSPSKFY